MLIILITGGLPMVLASTAIFTKDFIFSRSRKIADLSSLALVVGMNSEGALAFNDPLTAETNLSSFSAIPPVLSACLYDWKGELFAWYSQEKEPSFPPPRATGTEMDGYRLLLFQEIVTAGETIGTVFIEYDMRAMYKDMVKWGVVMIIILLVAMCLALVLTHMLQRIISEPVSDLADVARRITEKEDFSERARHCNVDEIKVLVDGFNDMLMTIQKRDEELEKYREHLEEKVTDRTSELRKANEDLKEAKDAAESANRAKSEFLAGMSHEIRTPLNAVLGFTELLTALATDEKQKSYLESIRTSGKSLLTLINDILDLSKIEARKMEIQYEPVHLNSIIKEVKEVFSLRIQEKGLDLIIDIDPDIPAGILLDEVRLRQVLFNLIGNSVKFTAAGHIALTARKTGEDPDRNTIGLAIVVEDTGVGISKDSIETIFDAFRQQDGQSTKKYGGTGLGLAITRRLTEMMDGVISVTSEINSGSRFEILFDNVKVSQQPPKLDATPENDARNIRFSPGRVLIVDDIETNRSLVSAYLMDTHIDVIEAENGETAVAKAKETRPDLIFMDIRMPVMDGFEATRLIRRDPETMKIPIIALTASGMKEDREKTLKNGFDDFLAKPVQRSGLFKLLAHYLEHETIDVRDDPLPPEPAGEISIEQSRGIDEIMKNLETYFMEEFESVRQSGFFNEIESFAERVKAFGEQYDVRLIVEYAEELLIHVGSFDIEKMNGKLNGFPNLLQRLKSCCKDGRGAIGPDNSGSVKGDER